MVQNTNLDLENDPSIQFSKILCHPPPGEDIVVSGMSGMFPLAHNVDEFKYNLDNKIEMITEVPKTHPELPSGLGLKKDKSRFDAGFFGIHPLHTKTTNPMCKMILEKCYEAIYDAGLHPSDLEGSKTGIFVGTCFCEFEIHWYLIEQLKGGNTIVGNLKSIAANRVLHHLKLKGPAFIADTACSSGAYALEAAFKAIRMGECDAALVASSTFLFSGGATVQFARLGVLSPDGHCRPFDKDGLGYVRAEATVVFLLQKSKDSKRIYANIIHTKTNSDGYKNEGITYPSGDDQMRLLKEMYYESEIPPSIISYIEAHGTGTVVGDPEELRGIDEFFTPGRKEPLLVGSVKSSIGHSEPAAMLCSLAKVILAFESNVISPNINYNQPRENLKGILEGRLKVVVENTPIKEKNALIGVSSFGFGGGNAHLIVKQNSKEKVNNGTPTDDLPRLICVSGRTEEAINCLLDDVAKNFDAEQIGLIHNIFRKPIDNHLYRGYAIVSKEGLLKKSLKPYKFNTNIYLYFGGFSKISGFLLHDLLRLPLLSDFNNRLTHFFTTKKLTLDNMSSKLNSNFHQFIIHMLTQVTFAELLKLLDVNCEKVLALSFGKFTMAYFKRTLSLEQFLDCMYSIGNITKEYSVCRNSDGINIEKFAEYKNKLAEELKKILPCHQKVNGYNGNNNETISPEYFLETIFDTTDPLSVDIQKDSVVLEIGQNLDIMKKKHLKVISISIQNNIVEILKILGSLYEYGQQPNLQKLYPKIDFPVSRGTPMISSKIKWKHDKAYFLPTFDCNFDKADVGAFRIDLNQEEYASLDGHIVDGRNLFPATGYLFLAWKIVSDLFATSINHLKVTFENCKFLRACSITRTGYLELLVMVQKQSGNFEIIESDVPVVTGTIKLDDNDQLTPELDTTRQIDESELLYSKDIYKELRLRGYNYKGLFKSLISCDKSATHGSIRWADNWIAFMDNMLQLKILGEDSRMLYVPTSIAKLTINPEKHLAAVNLLRNGDESREIDLPVNVDYNSGLIRSGGVEIRGLLASSIPRKKTTAIPVLEKYLFVPNEGNLPLNQAVRTFIQTALENNCGYKITVAELIDDATQENSLPIGPIISDVLDDQPLVQSDITLLTSKEIDTHVTVENKKLKDMTDCTIVVANKLLERNAILKEAITATKEAGYIISREPLAVDLTFISNSNLQVISVYNTPEEKLVFLKKKTAKSKLPLFINVNTKSKQFLWLPELKKAVKNNHEIVVWCQNEPLNGIIGLVNCIRREPECQDVKCLFIVDNAPPFDPKLSFYKNQIDKNLGINVYKNKTWGTYRHLLLDDFNEVEREHCYANSTVRGDLSSIKWIEGSLTKDSSPEYLAEVYYSAINFKDVMLASGKINADSTTRDRRQQECVQGFEFSGKTLRGKRVMGMLSQGTLATLVKTDLNLLWEVPQAWSLKEAATVPVVYSTCLYALVVVAKIKPGDSVLIHSGTGGIGQAAINLCLNMGCNVFTTVGTKEKREYILKNFPKIEETHIGNSRDLSFEQLIMKETNGNGVNIILNSLAEEKLCASVRCLSQNGRFLEIGKFDLSSDNRLALLSFKSGGSYHGVMLDKLFNESEKVKEELNKLLQTFIDKGAVKPLTSTVFAKNEVEQAYRFMTTGRHMGKVLVEIRDEEAGQHLNKFKGIPRYFCDPSKSYVICGGLGGFGLELADWLILRGAKTLILTSRKGISNGYQNYRISLWRSYGCNIKISTQDITTKSGCQLLIQEANSLAPVQAIFNLAVVLQDAILPNQTEERFEISFGPKAHATQHLDEITRLMCPELKDFVVFSSVSCGRGNAGQSNYGMSNSVMERICEKRRNDGYPALAIQWGAIGDVGLVAELQEDHIELEIGGTLQQSILSCLQVLDVLLRQNEAALVSSIVVAEKRSKVSGSIVDVVGGILGIRDIKSVSMHSSLAELGMDSMSTVEVKQTLEREFNLFLSPNEIRGISLARIQELHEEGNISDLQLVKEAINWTGIIKNLLETEEQKSYIIRLKSLNVNENSLPKVLALPGIEGVCNLIQNLTEMLNVQAFGVNYISALQEDSFPKMAEALIPYVKKVLSPHEPFYILAHSIGCNVALEVVRQLETLGYFGTVIFIDGSPEFLKSLIGCSTNGGNEEMFLSSIIRIKLKEEDTIKLMEQAYKSGTLEGKLEVIAQNLMSENITKEFIVNSTLASLKRMNACCDYTPAIQKLKSTAYLVKPDIISAKSEKEDYGLGQYFEQPIEVKVFSGTHTTILQNKDLADMITNNILKKNATQDK